MPFSELQHFLQPEFCIGGVGIGIMGCLLQLALEDKLKICAVLSPEPRQAAEKCVLSLKPGYSLQPQLCVVVWGLPV